MTTQQALREGFIDYLTKPLNQARYVLRSINQQFSINRHFDNGGDFMCIQGHLAFYWSETTGQGKWYPQAEPYAGSLRFAADEAFPSCATYPGKTVRRAYGLSIKQFFTLMTHNDADRWTLPEFIPLLCSWWDIPEPKGIPYIEESPL